VTTTELIPMQAAPPLSERLIRALEAHAAAEAHDIANCEQLAQTSDSPVMRLLLELIIEDEQHHHALLRRIRNRLRADVDSIPTIGEAVPAGIVTADPAAISSIRSLIRDEQEGARYMRHLARQEPGLYDGLFALLLETIARDSEKHAHIFRYILRRLEA
jgi:rubrerythrin